MQRFLISVWRSSFLLCPCLVQSVSHKPPDGQAKVDVNRLVVQRRGSDDTTSWTEKRVGSGRAGCVQHKIRSGSRYRSRSQVRCGGDCGRRRGVGVRSICLGAWEKRVEGREKNKTSRIWGDDVVWEVGSVINGKERAPVSHPVVVSCRPALLSLARPGSPASLPRAPPAFPATREIEMGPGTSPSNRA